VPTIADPLGISASTVYSLLVETIALKIFVLRWGPNVNQRVAGEATRTLKSVTPGA
jgi:hypothetical protein